MAPNDDVDHDKLTTTADPQRKLRSWAEPYEIKMVKPIRMRMCERHDSR